MKRIKIHMIIGMLLLAITSSAQLKMDICIQEVLDMEAAAIGLQGSKSDKTVYMNYRVQSTDWEGKVVASNVKIYKKNDRVNFFSDQANMYKDEKHSIILLKQQKAVIVNVAPEDRKGQGTPEYADKLIEVRVNFLKSCKVLKCEQLANKIKVLEVKATEKLEGKLKIDRLIYTYNTETKKILKCVTYYDKGFQVKKMVMEYVTLDFNNGYKFGKSAIKQVLSSSNKLLSKYKGYELIDNTKEN